MVQQPLHFHSSERLSGLVAEAILHLAEVFSAEIYARDLEHPEWVVLSSVMTLSYGNAYDIRGRMEFNMESRREKQPLEYPSAGSVFKRPVDNFAGRMVENVGLKGYSVGGAQVSDKHAGFIVNRVDRGGATAADVIALVRLVRAAVEEVYRYRLECEIRLISDGIDPEQDTEW